MAATLATVTVLTGMARAGLTIIDRLRASERYAVTDDLTGLGNRRHLLARLGEAIGEADGEVALLLIDLDGFKELNDTLGHAAGDEVLRQIGPRLKEALRDGDTLSRLGGDEFAVVLAPGDEASASATGLRLRAALERSFGVGGIRVHIDASIGIALFPEHSPDAAGLLQRADVAMYEAKRTRTGHEVYLPARDHHSRRRLELLGELRDGLAEGQLILHYQPKAEIATGEVRGVEALVRWVHPRRGLLMPADFLPLADHSGLGRSLTAFVLDRALEEIGAHAPRASTSPSPSTSAPPTCSTSGCRRTSTGCSSGAASRPSCLRLEVSEDVVMADPERTLEVLAALRKIGVATALDDFGAGHVSLGHLKQLDLDELKIDRSFVMRLASDDRDAAIVHATVDLGRRLGMRVVAEGVETVGGVGRARRPALRRGAGLLPRAPDDRARARGLAARSRGQPPDRYVNSGARSSVAICSSVGRSVKRSAASSSFGRTSTSPVVSRKACGLPSTQLTARSMSACSVSGSYQVAAVCSRPSHGLRARLLIVCSATLRSAHISASALEGLRVALVAHLHRSCTGTAPSRSRSARGCAGASSAPTGRGR